MKRIIFVIILFISSAVNAQEVDDIVKFKSAFIYHFTKYIEWPSFKNNDNFIICVFDDEIYDELSVVVKLKKMVGNQVIVLKKCTKNSDIVDCNILYLNGDYASNIEKYFQKISKKGVLTITDNVNGIKYGASIVFKLKDEKLHFELNLSQIQAAELQVSNQLILMSKK